MQFSVNFFFYFCCVFLLLYSNIPLYKYKFLMYLRVPLYKHKLYSTYGYLRTSTNFVTPTGDLNKYKFVISISTRISLLYEFMNNSDI